MEYIAFDAHKRYTQVSVETEDGARRYEGRIDHVRGALQQFLTTCERGSPVAVETVGTWDWIVDEIEAAGQVPQLVHARQAKLVLGRVNQTDKLDARGLNRLQRTGTLPTVWIPPGALRDQRDLPRTRRVLTRERTRLKNRIHATLAKYGLRSKETSDLFGRRGRQWLQAALPLLAAADKAAIRELLDASERTSLALKRKLAEADFPHTRHYLLGLIEDGLASLRHLLTTVQMLPLCTDRLESIWSWMPLRLKQIGLRWSAPGALNMLACLPRPCPASRALRGG